MKDLVKAVLIILVAFSAKPLWALDDFICQCKAKAPGYEATNKETGGSDKICSYSCNCIGWMVKTDPKTKAKIASAAIPNINLDVINAPTTAYSREQWDAGSHICHGQYAYKPSLSDENWKIKVKFDTFTLNSKGEVMYPEDASREIAQGLNYVGFKYSKSAPEIAASLKDQLKKY